jgi:hypothetical protein
MISTVLTTVLGGGAGMTVVLGVYDRVRNRKFEARKQGTTIKLDEATYTEIASRAEQTSSSNLMAVGAFWQGQFQEVEKQLAAEQDWRRRMKQRARAHREWDEELIRKLELECDIHVDSPPPLDPDDE